MKLGENIIADSGLAPFFEIANPDEIGIAAPEIRKGDALRTWVRSLSGFQKEAIVRSALTGKTWRLVSDEGPYLNGHDAAPCPLAFLSVGMVSAAMNEIYALAQIRELEIRKLRLIQNNYYTMQGSMQRRTMIGGAEAPELDVEIDCDLNDEELQNFLVDATFASPLNGLMRAEVTSLFKLGKNGQELPTKDVAELDGALLPDPGNHFAGSKPVLSETNFVTPAGTTPKKEVALGTTAGGSSLSDEQNRRLNIGAIAEIRADGMKEITHLQYSPHGTSFKFLASEDGRAPDALTFMSAGIGFCFMTQFGRFASMQKLDLPDYRIVQDTHFSLGGASGGTGKAGEADPVETHVYLETSEDDDVAQEMLDISERTCYLHAFCRTDLKTKLRVHRTR